MDDPLVSFMYLLLYMSVSVIVPYYPAKPKNTRDLKLCTRAAQKSVVAR